MTCRRATPCTGSASLAADMSGGEAEGNYAYDREATHQEGQNESERTEDTSGLLLLAESASSQSSLQMSKRQKRLKGRQLRQTNARKALAAKRWAQLADGAAERAADRSRAEKVAADRKAASARDSDSASGGAQNLPGQTGPFAARVAGTNPRCQ